MKKILTPPDYAVLASDGESLRWRNSAQWARNTMVNEDGRMKKTRNGLWEISDKGRNWLREEVIRPPVSASPSASPISSPSSNRRAKHEPI